MVVTFISVRCENTKYIQRLNMCLSLRRTTRNTPIRFSQTRSTKITITKIAHLNRLEHLPMTHFHPHRLRSFRLLYSEGPHYRPYPLR